MPNERRNLNLRHRREALREELKSKEYLRQIHGIMDKAETADPAELPGLRLKAECAFKLLAKTLPDLKQVDINADVTHKTDPVAALIGEVEGKTVGPPSRRAIQ